MWRERGQATVEWVALVLVVAGVALGALAARGFAHTESLGEDVATRLVCAARRSCKAARDDRSPGRDAPRRTAAAPPIALRAEAFQRLRGFERLTKRVWVVCLGYKRWRYELDHPRTPQEPMPVGEALQIANDCLNPLGFLGAG